MTGAHRSDLTGLLMEWRSGDEAALERLMPLVYAELRTLAGRHLSREREGHTLSATGLVHEAYINLAEGHPPELQDRVHFYAVASRVMRRVLVWHARRRSAAKRGGGAVPVTLEGAVALAEDPVHDVLALDQALEDLEALDPRLARVVECRHFGGLTVPETGLALRISPATVKRDWVTARAWLRRRLADSLA